MLALIKGKTSLFGTLYCLIRRLILFFYVLPFSVYALLVLSLFLKSRILSNVQNRVNRAKTKIVQKVVRVTQITN